MIDLTLKVAQDRPQDSSRYFEPVQPANGADRWHIGGRVYRLDYVAVPHDGDEPYVTLVRQTAQGRDYAGDRGRLVLLLRKVSALANDATLDAAKAYVQQVRQALVRVLLDEQVAPEPEPAPAPSWGGRAATIPVDEDAPMLDEPYVDPETGWSEPVGEEHQPLADEDDDETPEGTPTRWQPCANGDGRRAMHASGLCSECRRLDASMREGMARWPDDTLALLTVGELRESLRTAHDHGAGLDEEEDCNAFLDGIVRKLPIPAEERAAHGLPTVGRPASFERPGSAYEGVVGYDAEHRAVVPSSTSRLVRLSTRHPEPEDCKGAEYGLWCAVGSTLGEFLAEGGAPLTAGDIRVLAAHHNVSPFAVLDLLDKRGIAHEPNPVLVPESSEVEL